MNFDDTQHPRSGRTGRFIFVQRPEQDRFDLDQATSWCDSCEYASDKERAHADHMRIFRMLRWESNDRLEDDVEVVMEVGQPARITIGGHTTQLASVPCTGNTDLQWFAEHTWEAVDYDHRDYDNRTRYRTEQGERRLVAIDPDGCGCTECQIGEYLPWRDADRTDILRLLRGELSNNAGPLSVTITSRGVDLDRWTFSYRELAGIDLDDFARQVTDS